MLVPSYLIMILIIEPQSIISPLKPVKNLLISYSAPDQERDKAKPD